MARKWRKLRIEPYDPNAIDGDGDGIVQEGTAWERPAGTRMFQNGLEVTSGRTESTLTAGQFQIVTVFGAEVPYTRRDDALGVDETTPSELGATSPLSDVGVPSLEEQGLPSVRDLAKPATTDEVTYERYVATLPEGYTPLSRATWSAAMGVPYTEQPKTPKEVLAESLAPQPVPDITIQAPIDIRRELDDWMNGLLGKPSEPESMPALPSLSEEDARKLFKQVKQSQAKSKESRWRRVADFVRRRYGRSGIGDVPTINDMMVDGSPSSRRAAVIEYGERAFEIEIPVSFEFRGKQRTGTLRSEVIDTVNRDGSVEWRGVVYFEEEGGADPEMVGRFWRKLDDDGVLENYLLQFGAEGSEFESGRFPRYTERGEAIGEALKVKGSGFASIFNGHAFLHHKKAGIKEVKISAAWDGTYVWPRQGFREYGGGYFPYAISKLIGEYVEGSDAQIGLVRDQQERDFLQWLIDRRNEVDAEVADFEKQITKLQLERSDNPEETQRKIKELRELISATLSRSPGMQDFIFALEMEREGDTAEQKEARRASVKKWWRDNMSFTGAMSTDDVPGDLSQFDPDDVADEPDVPDGSAGLPKPADFPMRAPRGPMSDLEEEMRGAPAAHAERLREFIRDSGIPFDEPDEFITTDGEPFAETIRDAEEYGGMTPRLVSVDEMTLMDTAEFTSLGRLRSRTDEEALKRFTTMLLAKRLTEQGVDLSNFIEGNEWRLAYDKTERRFVFVSPSSQEEIIVSPDDPNYQELVNRAVVDRVVHSWAITSRGGTGLLAQYVANEMFDLDARTRTEVIEGFASEWHQKEAVSHVLAEMYKQTQLLLEGGPDTYTMQRGMELNLRSFHSPELTEGIFDNLGNQFKEYVDWVEDLDGFVEKHREVIGSIFDRKFPDGTYVIENFDSMERSNLEKLQQELLSRNVDAEDKKYDWFSPEALAEVGLPPLEDQREMEIFFAQVIRFRRETSIRRAEIEEVPLDLNGMSSFTIDNRTANQFDGQAEREIVSVISTFVVPRQRVLGTPGTGMGAYNENEMVVAGGGDISSRVRVEFDPEYWKALYIEQLFGLV